MASDVHKACCKQNTIYQLDRSIDTGSKGSQMAGDHPED